MFAQTHGPELRAISDFTELKGIVTSVAVEPLDHCLYHLCLAKSGLGDVRVVLGGESLVFCAIVTDHFEPV
ncbi:hypothetical protein BWR19_01655 [Halomonas sp. 1513]|nr:hypothetical protein [Halomonas sp. 1513]APX91753.1 hypothetical protein BWR19_01655 [Halomonas sp. 1513]